MTENRAKGRGKKRKGAEFPVKGNLDVLPLKFFSECFFGMIIFSHCFPPMNTAAPLLNSLLQTPDESLHLGRGCNTAPGARYEVYYRASDYHGVRKNAYLFCLLRSGDAEPDPYRHVRKLPYPLYGFGYLIGEASPRARHPGYAHVIYEPASHLRHDPHAVFAARRSQQIY